MNNNIKQYLYEVLYNIINNFLIIAETILGNRIPLLAVSYCTAFTFCLHKYLRIPSTSKYMGKHEP